MKSLLVSLAAGGLLLSVTAATAAEPMTSDRMGGSQGLAPSTLQSATGYAPGQLREETPVAPGSNAVPSIAPGAAGNSAIGATPPGGMMSPSAGGAQSSGY